jgi:hypothetical protein
VIKLVFQVIGSFFTRFSCRLLVFHEGGGSDEKRKKGIVFKELQVFEVNANANSNHTYVKTNGQS